MIIPSPQDLRALDAATISAQHISSEHLMERASKTVSNYLLHYNPQFETFAIYCGVGNNGGDGLCIARHLLQAGKKVYVFIYGNTEKCSVDFKLNYERLQQQFPEAVEQLNVTETLNTITCDCVIDALIGTGLSKPVTGFMATVIDHINYTDAIILAIDIPSGLHAAKQMDGAIIEADITITFEYPKLAFFFPENKKFVGEWMINSINLIEPTTTNITSHFHYITAEDLSIILQQRPTFAHKGSVGHGLIIGGSNTMQGAAELSGMACLRAGAGLVTTTADATVFENPELMHVEFKNVLPFITNKNIKAIAIGPGLGKSDAVKSLLNTLITDLDTPIVFDADALNLIAENKEWLHKLPKQSILTPHPKEFERLFGSYSKWDELTGLMQQNAIQHQIYILYKRAYTIIATPEGEIFFNSTGNAGMATAGSGDVLTGIITSLLAQGFSPHDACITGVYLHGLAGDLAMDQKGGINLVASDIITAIPSAQALLINN